MWDGLRPPTLPTALESLLRRTWKEHPTDLDAADRRQLEPYSGYSAATLTAGCIFRGSALGGSPESHSPERSQFNQAAFFDV